MKKFFISLSIFFTCILACGCDAIDAINPVVQTGKMQNAAKQIVDDATQMKNYSEQLNKQQLQDYNLENN